MPPTSRNSKFNAKNNTKIDQFFKPLSKKTANDVNSQERPRSSSLPPSLQVSHSKVTKPLLKGKTAEKPTKTPTKYKKEESNAKSSDDEEVKPCKIDMFFQVVKPAIPVFVDENEGHKATRSETNKTNRRPLRKIEVHTEDDFSVPNEQEQEETVIFPSQELAFVREIEDSLNTQFISETETELFSSAGEDEKNVPFTIYRDVEDDKEDDVEDDTKDVEKEKTKRQSSPLIYYPSSDSEDELPEVPETKEKEPSPALSPSWNC